MYSPTNDATGLVVGVGFIVMPILFYLICKIKDF